MAKWDIKDGFWCLDCEEGEEWNFAYILPDHSGPSTTLAVPNSLQMGWIKPPPYFCATTELGQDIAEQYIETPLGSHPEHMFIDHTRGSTAYTALETSPSRCGSALRYLAKVYVDDYIGLVIPTTRAQLDHVANGVMCTIHDIFPWDEEDPISLKKLLYRDDAWDVPKDILGFMFNGDQKTMWLAEGKQDTLIATLKGWLCATTKNKTYGIPFPDFWLVIYKVHHAFTAIPAGKSLVSLFYTVWGKQPRVVFIHRNKALR